ncbi:hypothetical protein [Mannheimia varigena]|uniref:hypothetical protein n=1 Tax=Mannheimia varigena TaxID=85404 RepID=UPI0015B4A55B|nr:hypothetical protein [Mannheimia varigena]QLD32898.1 hypothetical protein A6B42_03540 [Mannheimia varigena]
MKILNTFTLTILSGLVLSACSGGSGQSTPKPMHSPLNTIKQPHKPAKVQPTKPVDVQPTKPVDVQPTKPVDVQPTKPVDVQPTKPVDVQPTKPVDVQPTKPVDVQPTKPVDVQPTKPVDVQPTKPVDVQPTKPVDVQPTKPVDVQPTKPVDVQPTKPVDVQPTKPVDVQPTKPVDVQPTKPVDVQPTKPVDVQPTKPVDIQVEKPVENQFDNKTIFNTFNQNGGNFESGQWLSLKIDNQTIEVVTIKPNTEFVNKKSEGLFDKEGRLLGYYGYASLTHIKTDPHRPDEKFPEHLTFAMLEMDPSQKIRPTNDISYEGKFHYYYKDTPVKSLEGQIAAQYKKQNKELKMELFGEQKEYWVLKTNARKDGVSVSDEGNVFGQVYSNEKQPNATFDGAIYGKNGEVLAGTLDYDDYNNKENSWKGVVGAKAK